MKNNSLKIERVLVLLSSVKPFLHSSWL